MGQPWPRLVRQRRWEGLPVVGGRQASVLGCCLDHSFIADAAGEGNRARKYRLGWARETRLPKANQTGEEGNCRASTQGGNGGVARCIASAEMNFDVVTNLMRLLYNRSAA